MGDNNNKVAVMSDGVKTLDGMTGNTRYVIYDGKGKKMSAPKDMVDSKGFAAYATKLPGGTVELVKGNDVFNVPLDEAEAAIADGMRPFTFFKAGKNQPKKKDWNAYKTRTVDAGISKIQEEGQPAGYDPNNKWFVPDWNKPQDMTMWAEPTWMQQAEDDGYTRNAADDRKMAALGNAINTTSQAVADTYNVTMDDGSKMPDLSGKPSLDIKRYDLGSAAPDIIDDTAKKIAADRSYDAVMGRTNYDIHRRIKSGYEKSMRADEAKKKKENQIFSVLGGMRNPMTGAINGGTDRNKSAETKMYEAASLFMDRAEKMQSAAADNAGFWRGAKDKATDINTWTGGVADLNQMAALATALNKADKGGKLNTAEQTLLDAAAYYTQAAMDADDKLSTWYNVGSGVVESAPFMLEFMVNPIGGGSKALAKQMIKYTAKQFGKHLTNKAVRKAVQIGARQAAAVASGAAMAGTTGMPAVMADTYRRMNGKAMGAIGGDGALTFDQAVERDGFGEALKKSFAARTIENWTETAGWFDEILPVMGKYLKGSKLATKIMDSGLGKGMSKMFDKAANSKSGRLLKEGAEYIDNSVLGHAVKNVQDRVHFSGNIGETLEEFQGSIANSIVVGDQKLDTSKEGVFNRDNMIQTFLTCSVISGAMQAPSVVAGAYKGLSDYDYVKASNNARRVIGSQWDGVRQALQDASNKDRVQYLHNVLRSAAYSAEDKKAIMMYVGALAKHEASRFFRNATRLNNEQYAYRNRKKIIEEFEQSKQGLTDEDLQALDQYDNFEELDRQTDISRDPERAVQIERYMEAREDMYYYIDAMNRHISDRVNSRYQEMQGDINQDMGGRVVAQSNYSGGDVVVTGGRLAINEDGSVDKANSDKVIYYRDRDGRVHMSTPDMFSAASVTSEADIKAQLETEEREAEDMLEDEELNGGTAGGSVISGDGGAAVSGDTGDGGVNGVAGAVPGVPSAGTTAAGTTAAGTVGTPVEASADQQSAQPVSGGASVGSGYTAQVGDAVTAGGRDGVVVSVYDDEVIVNHGGSEYRSYSLDAVAPTQSTEQGATAGNSSNGQVATEMNSATQPTQPSQPVEAAQAMPTDAAGAVGVANGGDVAGGSAGDVTSGDAGSIAPGVDAAPEASVQMPMTDKGEEDFMRVAPNVTLDYLKGQGMSEEDIAEYVALQIRAAEAEVAKAGKAKTSTNLKKFKEAKSKAAEAKAKLDYWNQVGGLMQTGAEQVAEADTDTGIADGATTGSTGNTAADGAVPDVVMDNAADARARGYRMVMGEKVSRQEFVPGVVGNDVSVRFGNGANDAVQGNYVVVDAGSIQPSHKGGVRNHSFFLDEAQPKDRRDDASVMAAEAMANNMRPQEITEGVTAYTGAPVVNSRGEVIQGNNRSAALIQMHEQNGAEADKYKQYLVDHAEQFGVDADTVAGMEYPVLVRMVDVEDAEAIRLGNMTAQDTESGGVERIKPQQSYTRLGDKVRSFMRLLLDSVEEDQSYSEVIAQNAVTALKFLADHGAISNTQYQSAFDANGNVTAEAKLDLKEMAEFNLFEGGAQELPRMFRALPARVQKAILQTFMRDADSAEADRIKGDIQNAIVLFDRAMAYSPEFRSAKDYESAKRALFVYGLQGSLIEGDKPAKDLFDNFAFELAARFRSMTQKGMVQMFQAFYDKVQGAGMDLFHPDAKPMSKADAVRDVFNVELNKANDHEQKNENDVGNDTGDGETGRPGISADDRSGGETSQGNGNAESDGGVADGRTDVDNQGNPLKSDGSLQVESVSSIDELTDEDFLSPVRNVVLPSLPSKVDAALGINGRPIVIKKNIFERNSQRHSDLTAEDSRRILNSALYNPDMYGQNQKRKRPYNWIVINTKDEKGHNRTVVIEVNENKDSVEIVHWHYVDERGLAKIRRQAANEDGQLLILPSVTEEAGALSSPIHDLSVGKDNPSVSEKQKDVDKNVSGGVSEYRYGMTVRPFGIGNQPDGALRHEDGGGAYGTVVYDHPLTEEEAKNFNLTPLTEAGCLVGKRFSYELGGHTLYCEVLSAENGRVRFSVNGNSEMVWDYYEFMHKMKPVEESVSDSGVASEDASENENEVSENESLNDSDSEVDANNTANDGRASVREEVRESQRTPLKMRKMVEAVCGKLGLKVQWHDTLHANGYYDPDTRTVHIARDAVHPLRMVFGHEVTHAVKLMNPKAYDKLRDAVKKLMGEAEFAGSTRQKKLDYEYEGYTGYEIDYYEEEVVCDQVGVMLDSNAMAENLCRLINDRSVLSALKRAVRRVFEAVISVARMNNREQRAMLRLQHAIEDAIRNTDGNVDSAEENGDRFSLRDGKPVVVSPLEMSEEEKRQRGELLHNAQSIDVASNQIMKTERLTARKAAEAWWDNHISKPLFFDTEVGLVEIDKSSIKDSLSHGYRQEKLDAITSLPRGFKHAIYIGSMKDFNRLGVMNHYFAYPIRYNNQRRYVFCRAMADNNKNRLYVHEVFMGNSIKESDTLQTIASASSDDELHGGVALYKAVLKNILDTTNVDNDFTKSKSDAVNNAKGDRFSLRDGSSREKVLRDALVDILRASGLDVVTDSEQAQRVLDEMNGRVVSKGLRLALEDTKNGIDNTPTAISNNANPSRGSETNSISDANIDNRIEVSNESLANLNDLTKIIQENGALKPEEFLLALEQKLGSVNTNADSSQYFRNDIDYTLRLSNHRANDRMFLLHDHITGNTSLVVKMNERKHRGDRRVEAVEYVYFPDKLNQQTQLNIIEGIQNWIKTGEYNQIAHSINVSTIQNGIREHRVYHGSGAAFDAFDHSHMGEGEGLQAYGWGTYVTEVEGIGRTYAEASGSAPSVQFVYDGDANGVSQSRLNDIIEMAFDAIPSSQDAAVSEYNSWLQYLGNRVQRDSNEWLDALYQDALKLDPKKFVRREVFNRHLYTVEIPDDNGSNYLHWESKQNDVVWQRIKDALKEFYRPDVDLLRTEIKASENMTDDAILDIYIRARFLNQNGENLYHSLIEELGSDEFASKFLKQEADIDGISYPAEARSGGRKDGSRNFVIFNEADAKIVDHVRFFKTANGEAYGFTVGGKIYLDPRLATAETPIHEYAHLWADTLRTENPKEWQNVVELMKGTPVWEDVKGMYPELKTDEAVADEVLAHYSGSRGAEKLRRALDEIVAGNMDAVDKMTALSALNRVKDALEKFWKAVADFFGIEFTSAEDVADRVMGDLLNGVNPNKVQNSSSADVDEFAAKHHLNLNDVKKYADAMKSGNLGGASYAFKNIKRSVLLANEGLSMSQFLKVFNPIKKDLFGSFGSVEELRNEHIETELEKRNVMEAARKREEAEKEAERERLKEFELMSDEALDEAYMEAVRNNDEQRMRDLVNEAARRKGYHSTDEFRMSHRAPSYDEDGTDKSLIDVANNKDNIRDSMEDQFRMNRDKSREESVAAIRQAIQEIEKGNIPNVTIYRAVPKSLKEGSVRNGDWITLSESYAKQHGNHALNGEYRIMKEVVPADNLYWDGNDINEWGYDDKGDYVYRNTKNNRKLNELVVRDDKGEIIPLSKRFNSRKKDVRFSLIGTKGAAALDKAEEASVRLDNLAVAREMETAGKDAKAVKMATGWERGADGKWRYEIMDGELNENLKVEKKVSRDGIIYYQTVLGDILQNDDLYKSYPQLRTMPVTIQEMDGTTLGYYSPANRYFDESMVLDMSLYRHLEKPEDVSREIERIEATPEYKEYSRFFEDEIPDSYEGREDEWEAEMDEAERKFFDSELGKRYYDLMWGGKRKQVRFGFDAHAKSVILHEVQHAIQDIEGFARGGNESAYRNLLAGLKEKHDSWSVIEEFEDKRKELGSDVRPIDVYYALIDEYQSLGMEFGDGFAPSREAFDNGFNLWLRGYDNEGYEDAYNEYQRLVGKFGLGESDSRYNQLAGEVESRNVQKRMDMTAEERRNSLASETEDVAREDQIFIMEHAGSSEMGSRVNRHMAEIGERFDKEDLDSNQRAVVDVYSGKKNNETVTVKRADGDRKIVMRQGTENKAGTKHSLYRHYGRSEGEITADDVILIPEILRDGERISTKNGKGFVYSLEKDGVRYKVYTELNNNREEFCDFYTNKKGSNASASSSNKEFFNIENTQLSARDYNITTDAKIDSNSESSSSDAVNNAKGERFSLRDAGVSGERNLVAVHNISEEKLKQAFELGGFPMPSIAITKADMGHGEFGEISLVFGRDTVDPSDSQNKVYGEDAWTPVFPSIGYKLDEDKALSIYRKTNEASDLPLFESFRFHPENLVDRVGRNGVQDLVEYFRDSYEAKQLYLHDKGNAVTEYEKQKGEKYSAENIAFYDKILEEIGLDRLKNDKDNVQDAVKQAMVKYLGTDFENMRPRMVLPYVNSAIYNAVDYAENGNEKTGKDIKATQEKIDSRINQKDFEKWLTELFDGIIEKRGIRNEKDPYTSSGNRRKWEQLYDAVTLDNILKNMRKQPKRGGSGMFNGSPFGAAQREYRSMEEIRKDAEKRIRTVDAQEFESQREAIVERFSAVKIPGVKNSFSESAEMTERIVEAVAHSHTARGIYNYLKKYYPEVTMDVAKELADIVKDIQQLSARYFESKPYRAVGFDEVRLAVVPSDTDAAVVDRLKSMGIEVRPYERGNESERSAIVRDVTKERDLRFSLRGSKNTVDTDSYSSPARLTKRQVQKVFGGIWIADKQEFAKFAAAVNNFGIEHDGEGIVYTDNYLYAYYYNIDGVAIPYASVYLNADNSQELVKEIQDDIKRNQITINGIVESLWNESGENYRNYGNNTSQRNRRRNGTIRRKFQRKGRYLDNPSLYVKTGRGYEGLPDRGERGGLEDKGSRFSLRGTALVVERAEKDCLKNMLGEEFSGSVNGLYGVLPTVARERIREQVLREVTDFSDMERAAVRMADVSADTLGYLASENPDADWWEPVCERMRKALKNAGVAEELNDNDVRYLLWANGGKNGDAPMAQPIPSSKGNEIEGVRNSVGELEHLDPKDMIEGVRFSLRVADIDREDFESMIRHDRFREGWQDAMISVRRFQDELERASGVALQDYENAYIF